MDNHAKYIEGMYCEIVGEGKPIVALHGWSLDHRVMKECLEPTFTHRSGWKRIYVDLPGMGRSPASDAIQSTDDILASVLRFIDAAIPAEEFVVCGESYGGYLARGVIHERIEHVAGMLLVCPMIVADHSLRTLPELRIVRKDHELLDRLPEEDAQEFASMAVVQGQREWERFQNEILVGARLADNALLDRVRTQGYGCSHNVDDLPHPFDKPALIITGRQDTSVGYVDSWNILENYPRATFAVLDRAGHNLQIEQPNLFHALISEWLDRMQEAEQPPRGAVIKSAMQAQ